jgi:predicted RNA binding protein YcfA (HicA-like mRNA interferase family)
MGDKLPQISGTEMGRVLARLGFYSKSRKGSHVKFERKLPGGGKDIIIVPDHKVLRKGTLNGILKEIKLDIKKLKELL